MADTPVTPSDSPNRKSDHQEKQIAPIKSITRDAIQKYDLKALIVQVLLDNALAPDSLSKGTYAMRCSCYLLGPRSQNQFPSANRDRTDAGIVAVFSEVISQSLGPIFPI